MSDVEILSDGRSVWVNDSQGGCIGRFTRGGIDIHRSVDEQIVSGRQCLACKPGSKDWDAFVSGMLEHHGVSVGAEHKPAWVPKRRRRATRQCLRASCCPIEYLASPGVTPFVLVDEVGTPLLQKYSNGMTHVAGYRTLVGARRGRKRWGGMIWNRTTGRFESDV